MSKHLQTLVELLDDFDTGMLATRTPYGHISTRPMKLQPPRADRALWMVTSRETSTAQNIKDSSHVNLSFRRSSDQAWISIAATAKLNLNKDKIKSLWDESWDIWVESPEEAALIELEPFNIDFWEPEMGKLGRLLELAKAHVTDSTPNLQPVRSLHISDGLLASAMVGGEK